MQTDLEFIRDLMTYVPDSRAERLGAIALKLDPTQITEPNATCWDDIAIAIKANEEITKALELINGLDNYARFINTQDNKIGVRRR